MRWYFPTPAYRSAFEARREAMWYQHWQAGYADILARGYPKPNSTRVVLAELHSPHVTDFLHGWGRNIPFLVSWRTAKCLRAAGLVGYAFGPVQVAKIATKGLRNSTRPESGESEDVILKARDRRSEVQAPRLRSVIVRAMLEVKPDYPSGRTPGGLVSPFIPPDPPFPPPDLWQPVLRGKQFTAWVFCSEHFKNVCEEHELSNIGFVAFPEFMEQFRSSVDLASGGA